MANTVEFKVIVKDLMSSALRNTQNTALSMGRTVINTFNQVKNNAHTASRSVNDLNTRLDQLKKQRDITLNYSSIRGLNREIDRTERRLDKLQNMGRRGATGGSGSSLPGYIGAAAAGYSAIDMISTAAQNEGMNTAINFATNGNGAQTIAFIKKQSEELGLAEREAIEGAKSLYGALRGGKIPLQQQHEIVQGIMEAGAAMKITADDQKGAMLALSQMASKGVVSAEELRGQLGERIPGAFRLAAEAMGMTEKQFNKHLEKGEILANKFLPLFAKKMHETYGVAAKEASDSAQASINRYHNSMYELKVFIGKDLMPVAMQMINRYLIPGAHWIKENWIWIKELGGMVIGAAAAWKTYTTAQWLANAAMMANPAGILAAAIGVLAFEIIKTAGKYDEFNEAQDRMLHNGELERTYETAGRRHGELYADAFAGRAKVVLEEGGSSSPSLMAYMASLAIRTRNFFMQERTVSEEDATIRINYGSEAAYGKKMQEQLRKGVPGGKFLPNAFRTNYFDPKGSVGKTGKTATDVTPLVDRSDKINSGGPRVINFNFHKAMVEEHITVASKADIPRHVARDTVDEIIELVGTNIK